jgi:AraC-like DNA-binding protein
MDRLSPFFAQFALSARVFYSGQLCGASGNHDSEHAGHLHVLRHGTLTIVRQQGRDLVISEPSVLFYPRPCRHSFRADKKVGAEIVCATIEFGAGMLNPLVIALPEVLIVPLRSVPQLASTAEIFFGEAFSDQPGRQIAVDRLAEYFLVLLLRAAMEARLVQSGILLGLADPRLAAALAAIHIRPEYTWSLEELAEVAGMSRARFAAHFRMVVGITPFDYLTSWRIGVAQSLLKRGEPLKTVAPSVGFQSSTALSRAFSKRIGASPTEWLSRSGLAKSGA